MTDIAVRDMEIILDMENFQHMEIIPDVDIILEIKVKLLQREQI